MIMIAKKSDLILENFVIVESHLSLVIPNEQGSFQPLIATEAFPVLIDFRLEQENDTGRFRIVISVELNNSQEKQPGYSFAITGMGFFKFGEDTNLTEEQKIQILQISGLSICITNIRSYITNQTSYFPWGSFTFHAVDINALLNDKKEAEEKEGVN
jgi:preprotein translocase subunit SecB